MSGELLLIAGVVALVVAGVFAVFVPRSKQVNSLTGFPYIVVRWFHSLVWLLLAVACFLWSTGNADAANIANLLAPIAGITYLIYITIFTRLTTK